MRPKLESSMPGLYSDCGGDEVFDADGQIAHSNSGRMVDGGRDGWGHSSETDLADATGTVLSDHGVRDVEESHVDFWMVSRGGNDVIREVVINRVTVARIVGGGFEQAHTDAHDDGSCHLVSCGLSVNDAASVDDTDDAADAEMADRKSVV